MAALVNPNSDETEPTSVGVFGRRLQGPRTDTRRSRKGPLGSGNRGRKRGVEVERDSGANLHTRSADDGFMEEEIQSADGRAHLTSLLTVCDGCGHKDGSWTGEPAGRQSF